MRGCERGGGGVVWTVMGCVVAVEGQMQTSPQRVGSVRSVGTPTREENLGFFLSLLGFSGEGCCVVGVMQRTSSGLLDWRVERTITIGLSKSVWEPEGLSGFFCLSY